MISLKRYLDSEGSPPQDWALDCYRASLLATATFGSKACPPVGQGLERGLLQLQERVAGEVSPSVAAETQREAELQLKLWSERCAEYLKQKASEAKELMVLVARTAEAVGSRDQTYSQQFAGYSAQLQAIADLEDLPKIKESLIKSSNDLRHSAEKMKQESLAAVAQLRSELTAVQTRLEESERLASRDPLTGLDNRRSVAKELRKRARENRVFCVAIFDLNGFKQINDEYGHLAGDQVLKQFAGELKSSLRPADVVGRWGGDEFIVVVDCSLDRARTLTARTLDWVLGEYNVVVGGRVRKIHLGAAMGIAEARPGETIDSVIERADAAMYGDKGREGTRKAAPPDDDRSNAG